MHKSKKVSAVTDSESLMWFNKAELVVALMCVQHHCPPRPTRQSIATLRNYARLALASDKYGERMRDALRSVKDSTKQKDFGYDRSKRH